MKRIFFLLCLVGILFSGIMVFSRTVEESTLKAGYSAGFDYSRFSGKDSVVYIPKEWGSLKGVTSRGTQDILYFEALDGTVYVVQGSLMRGGKYLLNETQATRILRK